MSLIDYAEAYVAAHPYASPHEDPKNLVTSILATMKRGLEDASALVYNAADRAQDAQNIRLRLDDLYLVHLPMEAVLDVPAVLSRITRPLPGGGISHFDHQRMSFEVGRQLHEVSEALRPLRIYFSRAKGWHHATRLVLLTYGIAEEDLVARLAPYPGATYQLAGGYCTSMTRLYDTEGKVLILHSSYKTAVDEEVEAVLNHHRKRKLIALDKLTS